MLVLILALKKFSPGSLVFLCPQKSTLLNSNSKGICHSRNHSNFSCSFRSRFLQNEMRLTLVTGRAMIKWHTLNVVFEAFYNQSHSWLVSRDPGIEHSKHASVFLFESAFSDV